MKRTHKAWLPVLALLAVASAALADTVTLQHIHGLAYGADGKTLYVASHPGLATYKEGQWSVIAGPPHDYMGFSATRKYFYSSGHPPPGSGLVNPLGLVRSNNGGRTWDKLGLEGRQQRRRYTSQGDASPRFNRRHGERGTPIRAISPR
jgi:hypothetical protein